MEENESSSSSSTWSIEDDDPSSGAPSAETISLDNPPRTFTRTHKTNDNGLNESTDDITSVPADQERQILLLMLLAQVCALHDPTPRTFTVHVLELFERGILDRQSIHFLYDLNLVPAITPPQVLALTAANEEKEATSNNDNIDTLTVKAPNHARFPHRSAEVSAIRATLEQLEHQRLLNKATKQSSLSTAKHGAPSSSPPRVLNHQTSFAADQYPLSLSRYQREFLQRRLLASGSFGQVFCATHYMDGRDYAVKRVAFAASGFSNDSVQQVIRETQCLALCDHPNVVRYYTSWLEPSWMTGSSTASSDHEPHQRLLTNVQKLVSAEGLSDDLTADFRDYFKISNDTPVHKQRRYSFGDSLNVGDEESIWTTEQDQSKDDSYLNSHSRQRPSYLQLNNHQHHTKAATYQYQICLFIQMELCETLTLADWIRNRNRASTCRSVANRIANVSAIFRQLVSGLAHVHDKNIIHRDLKPANIFACSRSSNSEVADHFKLGDFGLSKLMKSSSLFDDMAQNSLQLVERGNATINRQLGTSLFPGADSGWHDPLTAGVGTASYAAPEQVASRAYGTAADIFSLGLILLELLCSFTTEHERLMTFSDCRHRRVVPNELEAYPLAAETILRCTDPDASKRPRAKELMNIDLMEGATCFLESTTFDLPRQLRAKDVLIAKLTSDLEAKQQLIDDLHQQVHALKCNNMRSEGTCFPNASNHSSSNRESSSSSDDDEL
ncbi:hypothetical protein MPSEU_000157500 [Mayamaea pseudoterrestris]|nr:hypothetical protein MPSEU_000157500 [Mayamaea pseudoterrestris]